MHSKIKPSFETNRQVLGNILPLDTPFTVILDVSEVCNFKCNYCFRSTPPSSLWGYPIRNDLMSWETFSVAADQLMTFPSQIKRLAFSHNGEPLCNKRLPDMVKYIKDIGFNGKTEIHTNASLLTPDYATALACSGIDKINISLQGLDSETYEKICGVKIDFDKFYDNIAVLYQNKSADTAINVKIMDTAIKNEENFYKMFADRSDQMFIEKIVPLFPGVNYSGEQENDVAVNKYNQAFEKQDCCPISFYSLVVSPDGTIYPCTHLDVPFILGNVNDITLLDAWTSKKRTDFLKKQLLNGRSNIPQCSKCYIPQNTVKTEKDLIDPYREQIFARMDNI